MNDRNIETMVATLLRTGVFVSGLVVVLGGTLYLSGHGGEIANYQTFRALPAADRLLPAILASALQGRPRSIIQTGILLLIATPILRVAFSLVGFALERDRKYVLITAIVLGVLLYSLVSGTLRG